MKTATALLLLLFLNVGTAQADLQGVFDDTELDARTLALLEARKNVYTLNECPNGVPDSTDCIQAVIDKAVASGKPFSIECSKVGYKVSRTLLFDWGANVTNPGFSFGGLMNSGAQSSVDDMGCSFEWIGGTGQPFLRLIGTWWPRIHDIGIRATTNLDVAVMLETGTGRTIREGIIERVRINGGGNVEKCFVVAAGDLDYNETLTPAGAGPDGNNDLHTWSNNECSGYTTAMFSFEHSQAKFQQLFNNHCSGDDTAYQAFNDWGGATEKTDGPYCVTTALGVDADDGIQDGNGGSFKVYGGVTFRNINDFWVNNPNDGNSVMGVITEKSGRFFRQGPQGFSGDSFKLSLINNRVHIGEAGSHNFPSDCNFIEIGGKGVTTIDGNEFSHQSPTDCSTHGQIHLYGGSAGPQSASITNNSWKKAGSDTATLIDGDAQTLATGIWTCGNQGRNAGDSEMIPLVGYQNKCMAVAHNWTATVAPGVNDDLDLGYGPGSLWLDTVLNKLHVMESNANGAAVWHILN